MFDIPPRPKRGVTVASLKPMTYLKSEVFDDGSDTETVEIYRTEAELIEACKFSLEVPITINHYDDSVDEVQIIGYASRAYWDEVEKVIKVDMFLNEEPPYKEISLGYDAQLVKIDDKYYYEKIKITHIAFVENGRCGGLCSVSDAKRHFKLGNLKVKDSKMKVTINDKAYDVDSVVKAHIEVLEKTVKDTAEALKTAKEDAVKAIKDEKETSDLIKVVTDAGFKLDDEQKKDKAYLKGIKDSLTLNAPIYRDIPNSLSDLGNITLGEN